MSSPSSSPRPSKRSLSGSHSRDTSSDTLHSQHSARPGSPSMTARASRLFHNLSHSKSMTFNRKKPTPTIESIVKGFLGSVEYKPRHWELDTKLRQTVQDEIEASGIKFDDPVVGKMILVAVAVADLTCPMHSFELKVHIAMYTWLSFCIDDNTSRMVTDIQQFQQRFYEGTPQPSPLLESYAGKLRGMYQYYDPIIASSIILSSLAFVDCCLLETRDEYKTMPRREGGENWAYYYRTKEGIADAYAYFNFPKDLCPDVSDFLQAIPDIGVFINLGNDILSFYKEEVAGETKNYVHTRAKYEGKTSLQILQEITDEAHASWARASKVLSGEGNAEKAWHAYVHGYIAMHKSQSRYRLSEIGLGEVILPSKQT